MLHLPVIGFSVGIVVRRNEYIAGLRCNIFDGAKTSPRAKMAVLKTNLWTQHEALVSIRIDDKDVIVPVRSYKIAFLKVVLFGCGVYRNGDSNAPEPHSKHVRRLLRQKTGKPHSFIRHKHNAAHGCPDAIDQNPIDAVGCSRGLQGSTAVGPKEHIGNTNGGK